MASLNGPPPHPEEGGPPSTRKELPNPMFGDGPEAYIDKDTFDLLEIIINIGIVNSICVLGVITNILNIYILKSHGFKSSMSVMLTSLAIVDLLLLVTLPLRKISLIVNFWDPSLAVTVETYVLCGQFLTLNRVWSLSSHTHVVIIALERFLAVFFPFDISRWSTPKATLILVMVVHASWYVLLFPLFTFFDLDWVFVPHFNTTVAVPVITDFYLQHEQYFNFYFSFVLNLLSGTLMFVIVFVCSIATGIKISMHAEKRQAMISVSNNSDKDGGVFSTTSSRKVPESGISSNSCDSSSTFMKLDESISESPDWVNQSDTFLDKKLQSENHSSVPNCTISGKSTGQMKPRKFSSLRKVNAKVVRMLLVVCFVFLVCIFPTFSLYICQYMFDELKDPYWRRVNFLATSVTMVFLSINSSANFFIYVATSKKFYNTFRSFFKC